MVRRPFTAEVTRVFGCSDKTDAELRVEINKVLLKRHIKNLSEEAILKNRTSEVS